MSTLGAGLIQWPRFAMVANLLDATTIRLVKEGPIAIGSVLGTLEIKENEGNGFFGLLVLLHRDLFSHTFFFIHQLQEHVQSIQGLILLGNFRVRVHLQGPLFIFLLDFGHVAQVGLAREHVFLASVAVSMAANMFPPTVPSLVLLGTLATSVQLSTGGGARVSELLLVIGETGFAEEKTVAGSTLLPVLKFAGFGVLTTGALVLASVVNLMVISFVAGVAPVGAVKESMNTGDNIIMFVVMVNGENHWSSWSLIADGVVVVF